MMAFRINNLPKTLFSERDRDRQRERQRQERAQMLPNDDKDISTGAQDLFHAPVKVEPSVEDRTTLEIRNTLGNFEHVKHYVVDGASRNLIGVDQNSNPSHRQRSSRQSGSSGSNSSSKIPSSHRNYSPLPNPSNTSSTSQNNLKASNVIQKVPHTTQNQHHSSQLGGGGVNTSNNNNNSSSIVPPTQFSGKKSNNLSSTTSSSSSLSYTNNCNSATEVGGLSVTTTLNNNGNSVGGSSLSVSDNFSAEIINEIKTERGSHSKKPALERVDSQLELESMIKEMMDVTPPITALAETPAKESPAKKYTPRRASKSEEKIVLIREGMTNIPPPLKKMDTSESSSTDTESSSDSEDSSSGSQGGTENQETTISKPPPTTNSPTRWNLSSFIRKDNIKGTPDSTSGTATTIKSPKDSKSRENPHTSNAIDSEESPGEVSIKLESNVTSTSVFGKSMSSSPAENTSVASKTGSKSSNIPHVSHLEVNEGPYSKVLGKSPRKAADVKADPFLPIKVPTTIPMKGSSASSSVASKIASLSATSSDEEEDEEKPPKEVISRSIPQEKPRVGGKQGTRKRPRHSSSSERPGIKSDDDDSSPEADRSTKKKVQDRNKNATITKLFRPARKKERIDSPNRESEDSKGIANSSRGKGSKSKPSPSNRVPAKDTGRKCNTTTAATTNSNNNSSSLVHNNNSSSLVHNGDLDSKVKVKSSSSSTGKKRRESSSKGASSSHSSHHHSRKHGKSHSSRDSHKSSNNNNNNNEEGDHVSINPPSATMVNIVTPSSAVNLSRVKEEAGSGKSHPPSTLMCRIPLFKLPRPPGTITTTSTNSAITSANSAIVIKSEKDADKGGGDQDTYLEEAKRLKHKADNEKLGTTQASMYLEAGLYFILTGISMERDRAVGQQAAFTMYKDTLSLIRYIGTRFRSGRTDYSNVTEAKIIVLSMRCQSLLSLKLFKIKMRETKDVVQYLTEHFTKAPVDIAPIPNSPQLIIRSPTSSTHTSSPHSPTSSPAGSSGIRPWEQQAPSSAGSGQWGGGHTPSPHHPHQNHHVVSVPRSIYSQMYKQCVSTMNLISAHELWETADSMVERYHMEEFFASIDRQCGPLTLHNSLVDLVTYVKHGLKLLKIDDS